MDRMVVAFQNGGPFMYGVLGLLIIGGTVALIPAIVAALRIRVPALVWLLLPGTTVALGVLGRVAGLVQLGDALPYASPDQQDSLTFAGLAIAPLPEWMALWGTAVLLALTALLVGLAAVIGAGKEARWSWGPAVAAAGIGAVGWLAVTAWAVVSSRGLDAVTAAPAGLLLLGGMGIVLAAARIGTEDRDAQRGAAARALAATCTVLAVGAAVMAARIDRLMLVHEWIGSAMPEELAALLSLALFERAAATRVGVAAMAVAAIAGAIPALAAARALFKPYALVSSVATLLALGVLGGLHGVGWYQARSLEADTALMRSLALAEQVDALPAPPPDVGAQRVSQIGGARAWDGGGWTELQASSAGTEFPSMEVAGDDRALLALAPDAPARVLIDHDPWADGRMAAPSTVALLTERPAYPDEPRSPYLDWTRLGEVAFLWLPGDSHGAPLGLGPGIGSVPAEEPVEDPAPRKTGKATLGDGAGRDEELAEAAGILAALIAADTGGADLFGTAAGPWPPMEESVYVLDGGMAPGAGDLGLPADTDATWVVAVGAAPREIPRGDGAAAALAEAVQVLGRSYVVFLPADHWTVEELVGLCLTAAPPRTHDPYGWDSWGEITVRRTCAIDRALPAPAGGPRLMGLP